MGSNIAAWLVGEKVKPLQVKTASYASPGDKEILVKNAAVAVNPVDYVIQERAFIPLQYPTILGSDVAGEVVEAGKDVTKFKKGDRVLGFALGIVQGNQSESGFQLYTVLRPQMTCVIPNNLPFDRACVIPLCLATAAAGLYMDDYLHLQYPSLNPQPTHKSLLIWGGASSVGSNAIQLAVASGYTVLTTASSKNFEYVKKLGASQVFDYNEPSVVDQVVAALDKTVSAGISDAVSANGAIEACLEIASRAKGDLFVSTVRPLREDHPSGDKVKWCQAAAIENNDVGKVVFGDFLPHALANGSFVAAPDPHIVGEGLEHVQAGLDLMKEGMSAKKLVITL
ncbi:MAG: hypothetical protein Q9170_006391 [Blastenia crenularia]